MAFRDNNISSWQQVDSDNVIAKKYHRQRSLYHQQGDHTRARGSVDNMENHGTRHYRKNKSEATTRVLLLLTAEQISRNIVHCLQLNYYLS
jgi:hypothetical protein